ncbi:hypothetical protein [Marispirochaeta aestuarii]|uniref:hypothetical protein n=1 Tax=Marispirochaeta aestuarii TaxID=1963862 RepID=UPI0029C6DF57|nr:hypothetical protein [Marispirochaeta aestuarii]
MMGQAAGDESRSYEAQGKTDGTCKKKARSLVVADSKISGYTEEQGRKKQSRKDCKKHHDDKAEYPGKIGGKAVVVHHVSVSDNVSDKSIEERWKAG